MPIARSKKKNPSTPYGENFDKASIYDTCLIILSVLGIVIPFQVSYFILKPFAGSQTIVHILKIIQVFAVMLPLFFKWKQDEELDKAYNKKSKCELDAAFDSKLYPKKVKNYFDVNETPLGYKRLLAITHENALFTRRNASVYKSIILKIAIVPMIILVATLVSSFMKEELTLNLFSFVIGFLLYDRCHSANSLENGCNSVVEKCQQIITTWSDEESAIDVLSVFLEYNNLLTSTTVNIFPSIHTKTSDENHADWLETYNSYYKESAL